MILTNIIPFWKSHREQLMQRVILLFLTSILINIAVSGTQGYLSQSVSPANIAEEDSLLKLQFLYRGVIWTNKYRRYDGDQFFLTSRFIQGTVSVNGHTYKNLRLKYDIYTDEIITPLNMEEILQLNKEMIDSFSLSYENRTYRFINIVGDSAGVLNGYCNLLYKGRSALYVKYVKKTTTAVTAQSDGEFNQSFRILVLSGDVIYPVKNTGDLSGLFGSHRNEMKDYISEKKLKVSKNDPSGFIPVIEYFDLINH